MNDKFERQRGNNRPFDKDWNAVQDSDEAAAIAADDVAEAIDSRERRCDEFSKPVCIDTEQIYDACRDRDCCKDQRVYFSVRDQAVVEDSINVKVKDAKIIWVASEVEPIPFNRGYFAVDIKYFVCVTFDAYRGIKCPVEIKGLTTFDKRVVLFGSEGNTKSFESTLDAYMNINETWYKNNMPKAVISVVDPIVLSAKLVEEDDCCHCCCCTVPKNVAKCFDDDLVVDDDVRKVLVSYGLFTIVRMQRPVQLLIDAIDFCIPTKECVASSEQNPCGLFDEIRFPIDEFFPPTKKNDFSIEGASCSHDCGCGC